MPTYLSDAWIAALNEAAGAHPGLATATAGVQLVLEQVVTPDEERSGHDGSIDGDPTSATTTSGVVRWHLVVDDGSVHFVVGPATDPTVRFTTDAATARAITEGRLAATEAFMAGRLRVGGDTTALVEHHALFAGLGEVFAAVHAD